MQKNIRLTFHLALLLFTTAAATAHAEVLSSAATGFSLKITGQAPVSPDQAYAQFIKVADWWDASHSYYGDSNNFSIEPRAGGCFCEKSGDNEVLHMLVTFVRPGVEVRMVGGLGPLQMMGVHGGMSWTFTQLEDGNTLITQTYNVTGYSEGGLAGLAPIVDAVQTGQHNALLARLTPDNP